jgi:WD40 repeat protein
VATAQLDNRRVIISGGVDGTVRVWGLATGMPIGQPLTGHTHTVSEVATAQLDNRPVIISGGSYDGTVRTWDLTTHAGS